MRLKKRKKEENLKLKMQEYIPVYMWYNIKVKVRKKKNEH